MSKSGCEVSDEVIKAFTDMKLQKTHRYISIKIEGQQTLVLEHASNRDDVYKTLFEALPNEPRYYVVDFDFELDEGEGSRSKLVFLYWCPDTAKVKEKMLYASSKEALRKKLEGIAVDHQANDKGDASEDYIISRLKARAK